MKKIHNYDNKTKKDNKLFHLNKDVVWIIEITLLAFTLSFVLSMFSDKVVSGSTAIVSVIVLLVFIFLGIIFDMVGVAVTVADEKVFNSMASKKIRGAKRALRLLKSKSKVSSFCNDVVGDVCGILSGSAGVTLGLLIANEFSVNLVLVNLILTSLIAAFTIGGKAVGKSVAINKSNRILYLFAKFLDIVTFKKS